MFHFDTVIHEIKLSAPKEMLYPAFFLVQFIFFYGSLFLFDTMYFA